MFLAKFGSIIMPRCACANDFAEKTCPWSLAMDKFSTHF